MEPLVGSGIWLEFINMALLSLYFFYCLLLIALNTNCFTYNSSVKASLKVCLRKDELI